MRFHLVSLNTPFIDRSTMLIENGNYNRINGANRCGGNRYNSEKPSRDNLETSFVDSPVDYTMFYSMVSPSIIADIEQPQEPQESQDKQHRHNNQFSCYQELEFKAEDHQELYPLPDMLTKNIFNSQSSMVVCSSIPQISSVQSFIDANISFLANDAAPTENQLFFDSTIAISFDQSLQDLCSCRHNSVEASPFAAYSSLKVGQVPTVKAPTSSLEAAVNSKRQIFQVRKQNRIEGLNFSDEVNVSTSMFLNHSWVPLVRGRNFGGNICKPPKNPLLPGTRYVAARLRLEHNTCEDMCLPEWNELELQDSRRIIRIERRCDANEIIASFSIVGSATENPETRPVSDPGVRVLEVSCLQCLTNDNESDEEENISECSSYEASKPSFNSDLDGRTHKMVRKSIGCKYYVTSVEVIKIIELLVGSHSSSDVQQRRKERGRMRSNLVQFWSKHLISSSKKTMSHHSVPESGDDYFAELACRINAYEVRKPRVFDKSVKILEWSNLGPALQRAIQNYYTVQLDETSNEIVLTYGDHI